MISVRFQPGAGLPPVVVEVDDSKLEAVLQRAAERVFPGPFDPAKEAESEARFQAVMLERELARHAKPKKRRRDG